MTYHLLVAADHLGLRGVSAEVVHVPTIKPLDEDTLLASASRTGRVVSAEEAQIAGGFGGAIAELLSERMPLPLLRFGVHDRYGESGSPDEVLRKFQLAGDQLADRIHDFVRRGATT